MHTATCRYLTASTHLGTLLVAANAAGITHVSLGDGEIPLVAALRAQSGDAAIEAIPPAADDPLRAWVASLASHLDHGTPLPALPLSPHGTPFQQRVWQALQQVPTGQTVSYADVARTIGQPRASRAVGTACGANRVAILIPCHRAVRGDGSLGGFRWGLERKRALLDRERHAR